MTTIRAESSNGRVWFDQTGTVTLITEYPDCKGSLSMIARIDVESLRNVYPMGIPPDLDILECGYWTHDGTYEPPLKWDGEGFLPEDAF